MGFLRASTLALIAGITFLTGCAQDHKTSTIEHPDLAVVRIAYLAPHPGEKVEGSGFFVSEDGLIVTSLHCLIDHDHIAVVRSDGQTLNAEFVQEDRDADMAIIQVRGKGFPFLKLHDDDYAPVMHIRIANGMHVVNGAFDHWENFGEELALTVPTTAVDIGSPVLADDGSVIGVVRWSLPKRESECIATRIWHVAQMMRHP
ncbi:MAG TPA: serine protease [Humisphaera sp.]|nr:serine protease [Humisphaera sp.]